MSYDFNALSEYLTDSTENMRQLVSGIYIDPDTKVQGPLDDEKKTLLIFEIYDNLEQLGKQCTKVQTALRKQFKFTKKQVEEYFEEDAESKETE